MSKFYRKTIVSAIALTMAAPVVLAAAPVVQGPESVQEWFANGQKFIADSKKISHNHHKAKNVILFVGDGMGISTITAARIMEGQLNGKPGEENRLSFENFPNVGLSKTYSWDQQTSDSAPTMTAMITGYKAREGMLSVDHLTSRGECDASVVAAHSLPTLLEQAAARRRYPPLSGRRRYRRTGPAACDSDR